MGIIIDFATSILHGDEEHRQWLLDEAIKFESTGLFQQFQLNANRYEFLRDEDNWGEDEGEDSWANLAESHGTSFDKIVDSRIAKTKAFYTSLMK